MALKRTIKTTGLLFAAIAGILGSGWLFGPYFAAQYAGPAAILGWILGGVLMMFIALTFAELASTFPLSGGTARFLQLSHGPLISFAMAWIGWISSAAVAPIETMALIHYVANYLPWLMHKVGSVDVLTWPGIGVAAFIMLLICILNSYGVKLLAKTNNSVVIIKLLIPILTIITLLTLSFHRSNFTRPHFAPYGFRAILASLPAAGIIFSYIGYSPAIQLAGEVKNPARSIPIAIIGALLICITLFTILQVVFIVALPPHYLANGWHMLSFAGDTGPFAGIATALGAAWLAYVIIAGAVFSPFGTALIYTAATSRMCYAISENGFLPKALLKLNRHHIPTRIIALNYVIGLFLFLPFPTWQSMVGFLVSSLVFAYAVGPLSLIILRDTLPDHPRPFKVPFAKVFCLIAFYICNLIVYWSGWYIVYKMMIVIIIGYVVLYIYKHTKHGKHLDLEWRKSWWMFFYIGIMLMISFLGDFGGGRGVIPFGWDFLLIAFVSWVIYELSRRCSLDYESAKKHIDHNLKNM